MKNTVKLSLLLLLGAAQQGLQAKPPLSQDANTDEAALLKARKEKPTVKKNEIEKKRVIYHAIKNASQDPFGLPQCELEWSSLPPVKNVTEAQVLKAKHECKMQNELVEKLCEERNHYLMDKYPAYKEDQLLFTTFARENNTSNRATHLKALIEYGKNQKKELMMAYNNPMNQMKILAAEEKAQTYFWKYWQLQNQYDREHPQFHGTTWKPYQEDKNELTPAEMKKQAQDAETITLAPGKSLLPSDKNGLPVLHSGNGALNLERVLKYSLAYPDGTTVTADQAVLTVKEITKKQATPGASATRYEYILALPKHAKLASFYVLNHHVNGDISVYATVKVAKEKAPAPREKTATTKPSKPKKAAPAKPKKAEKVVTKKHTPGRKNDSTSSMKN